jgi:hypothetical protein
MKAGKKGRDEAKKKGPGNRGKNGRATVGKAPFRPGKLEA